MVVHALLYLYILFGSIFLGTEGQHIHGAHGYAHSTGNASCVEVSKVFLFQGVLHNWYTNLAMTRTLVATYTFVIGCDLESAF